MLGLITACASLACGNAQEASRLCSTAAEKVEYLENERVLCINGPFDEKKEIRNAVLAYDFKKKITVVIKSAGGYLRDSIDVTYHLEKKGYDVVVDGMCASACAQFIFMGSDKKYIINNGIVAIHGGPKSDEQIDQLEYTEDIKLKLKQERDELVKFYKDRNIDLGITRNFPQVLLDKLSKGELVFWIPKEDDFKNYGVSKLRYCNAKFRDPDNVK